MTKKSCTNFPNEMNKDFVDIHLEKVFKNNCVKVYSHKFMFSTEFTFK